MVPLLSPPPFLKSIIGRFSNEEWALDAAWRPCPISKGDPWLILLRGKEGFGGFAADRLRDRLLSTQRMSCGRDLDFIYAKNSAQPGSDADLHKRFMGTWFNTNLVRRMGARVNTTSALRALVLRNLLRTTSGY